MKTNKSFIKYKIYSGRFFLLKNKKFIPCTNNKIVGRDPVKLLENKENFPKAIYIYDEINTKIKTLTLKGKFVWIPKNCLYKEIEIENKNKDKINELIQYVLNTNISNDKKIEITTLLRTIY